ncbi:MAG TPA: hypothetical protein PLG52_11125, partial [Anaerolineales bacterium]|nr:hypothetical protein [Anaerolineales bacterium]
MALLLWFAMVKLYEHQIFSIGAIRTSQLLALSAGWLGVRIASFQLDEEMFMTEQFTFGGEI